MAKCLEKVFWPQRITPGNCVLLGVSFRLRIQVVGFEGSQQQTL